MSDDSKIITVRPDYTLQAVQLTGDPEARAIVQGWALTIGATIADVFLDGAEEGQAWFLFREAHPKQFFMQYPEDFVTFYDTDEPAEMPPLTIDQQLREILDTPLTDEP